MAVLSLLVLCLYSLCLSSPRQHGACVNAMDLWQFTPLHEAASKNRVEVCSLLLSHGADPTLLNCHSKSSVDMAPTPELKERLTCKCGLFIYTTVQKIYIYIFLFYFLKPLATECIRYLIDEVVLIVYPATLA